MEVQSEPRYFPLAVPNIGAHVSIKVIQGVLKDMKPYTKTVYDSTFKSVVTQQMMAVAGRVMPWVDRRERAVICEAGEAAKKANEAYNRLIILGLNERDELAAPCEFYKPTINESTNYGPNPHNATSIVTLSFAPQLQKN